MYEFPSLLKSIIGKLERGWGERNTLKYSESLVMNIETK